MQSQFLNKAFCATWQIARYSKGRNVQEKTELNTEVLLRIIKA